MAQANTSQVLSNRAQDVSNATAANLMWDILSDIWCPSTNPGGYVNVGVAENGLMHDELLKYINTKLELPAKYLTYNDGGGGSTRLRSAVSQFLNRHLHPVKPLEADQLVITNGVSSAIGHVSWAFADPGEGILLGRPYYGTFIPDLSQRPQSTVVPVNFEDVDPLGPKAVEKYEKALLEFQQSTGQRVKALMLCHPHNPLGRCYPRDVIIELMKLCQKYQIHLISDEIYALSVWDNTIDQHPPPVKFESALSIDPNGIIDPRLVHALWGMSKDFGANGIRLGVIISQHNIDFHNALKGISLYSYPSGISDHLTALILEDSQFTESYIQQNQKKLSDLYAYTATYVKNHGIEYATGCNAAFFLWVNLGKKYRELHPELSEDEEIGEKVMSQLLKHRVFLASGALFGSEKSGWFRIVFSQPRDILEEALKRILAALQD
ncbi:uncharacterized protein N7498_007033 [Penicillium cinerascens]|uniref:Aminotransferase class I/classII large domain-containing protein n=1 Tax=Penicillium cinerascens TaxID=70096 RepID=A0A9W9JKU4_9EURO|nr:uncharacterized protein N7498_007033 [Penicillium cinerascens]KAJ5197916.1 hypothetical protein N7498_007033 [Penicillium cinerascens]